LIRAPVQALYDFHLDTNNLRLVQPPGFSVEELYLPPQIRVGAEIRLVVRILGLFRQRWLISWEEIQPPVGQPSSARLTDRMVEGPFPVFRQEHIFTQENAVTRLTDRVTFEPPLGLLGWMILPLLYAQLQGMFWWRHRRTRSLLEARLFS
jgi:ligand-binding SRPBCC domain-containing protein